ncbi:MAG: hypothetical protein ACI9W1_001879 [Candidatus Azotimanducaceae bacterium]|jgi:hypothetical protein
MVRYLIVGLLVTAALIGVQLYRSQNGEAVQTPLNASKTASTKSLVPAPLSGEQTLESSKATQAIATHPQSNEAPDNVASADGFQQPDFPSSPWQTDESPPETPARYVNRGIDVRPLKIDKQQLADISMGDTVKLSIPQNGQDYEMSVKEIGRHMNGDKSLKGYLVSNPEYTVVMTEGRTATFATINTPDGSFLLEASGDEGWMMSLAELDSLVDPNLVDFKIPQIQRQGQ